jgi:hypothetical protein
MLGAVAVLVLASMWVGRWWSVAPTFSQEIEFGGPEIGITLASLGAFGLSLDIFRMRMKAAIPQGAVEA